MVTFLLILVVVLSIAGIVGCIAPGLPGVPLNYAAMLLLQYLYQPFSTNILIVFGIISLLTLVVEYVLPVWLSKRYGASNYGIWGGLIGTVLGIFFTPIGMVFGMLLGSIAGELLAGNNFSKAIRSGFAIFIGNLFSMGVKLIVAIVLTVYCGIEIWKIAAQ